MPTAFRLQVAALDYIDKSLSNKAFKARIETALFHANSMTGKGLADDSFIFESPNAQIQVPFKDILYIETSSRPHRLVLYTYRGRTEFTANLSDILEQEKRLYKCHRSFVVNPANIARIEKKERILYFPNGATCLIARTKLKGVLLFLFSYVSGQKLTSKIYLVAILTNLLYSISFSAIPNSLFSYLIGPTYSLIFAWIIGKSYSKTLKIFYGLFPITLWNLIQRLIIFFIFPLFGFGVVRLNKSLLGPIMTSIMAALMVLPFLRLIQYNFKTLSFQLIDQKDKKVLIFVNLSMIIYHLIVQILAYLENESGAQTLVFRESLVVFYLILFMSAANYLDKRLRERIQSDLMFQKDLQLKNLKDYSHHIEGLYTEVRSFRHDYANILTTLKLGIEQNDIEIVKNVYDSVLKDSNKHFRNPKYDIGRLIHIKNDALKSLLAAKCAQAQEHNVAVSLEIPEDIYSQGMELVDFITIVSVLCDNAIEAAAPNMTIAYVSSGQKQIFSVENSVKEESVDISQIFDLGVSSKGATRGVGLHNVISILDRYPNVSLNTTSQNYCFRQTIEIQIKGNHYCN